MRRKTAHAYDFRIRPMLSANSFGQALGDSIVEAIATTPGQTQQQTTQQQSAPPSPAGQASPAVEAILQGAANNPANPLLPDSGGDNFVADVQGTANQYGQLYAQNGQTAPQLASAAFTQNQAEVDSDEAATVVSPDGVVTTTYPDGSTLSGVVTFGGNGSTAAPGAILPPGFDIPAPSLDIPAPSFDLPSPGMDVPPGDTGGGNAAASSGASGFFSDVANFFSGANQLGNTDHSISNAAYFNPGFFPAAQFNLGIASNLVNTPINVVNSFANSITGTLALVTSPLAEHQDEIINAEVALGGPGAEAEVLTNGLAAASRVLGRTSEIAGGVIAGISTTAGSANTTEEIAVADAAGAQALNAAQAESEALTGTALAQRLGAEGEQAVGITGPKVAIKIPGSGQVRIPDQLTSTTLTEVKNVSSLSYTQQLRDFSAYSQQTGRTFELYVRGAGSPLGQTQLSEPLAAAVRNGEIVLKPIPGTE